MRQPYSGSTEVTTERNKLVLNDFIGKFGECFLSRINQLYVNPVQILGRGYTFLRFENK